MEITDIPELDRYVIGAALAGSKKSIETLREMLFLIDEDGDAIEEKVFMGQDIFTVIIAWMKGEDPDTIAESVFQSGEETVLQILDTFGIHK